MAITNPDPSLVASKVVDGYMIRIATGKSVTIHKANNNLRNSGRGRIPQSQATEGSFIDMNQLIAELDAIFALLPPF